MGTIEKTGYRWIRSNHYAVVLIIAGMLYFFLLLLFVCSG